MTDLASSQVVGRGVAFPFSVNRRGTVSLAGGSDDVEQAIYIILSTAPGERPMRPEFGCRVHDYVFDDIDASTSTLIERAVHEALERWEPRIEIESLSLDLSRRDEGMLVVDVDYRLRDTTTRRNLVYPFYTVPAG